METDVTLPPPSSKDQSANTTENDHPTNNNNNSSNNHHHQHNGSSSAGTSSDDSDIEGDLVSAINYNTISSLTALRDTLAAAGHDDTECGTFFQHYFLNHVNTLPSRNVSTLIASRRLSECVEEEDEEDDKRDGFIRVG